MNITFLLLWQTARFVINGVLAILLFSVSVLLLGVALIVYDETATQWFALEQPRDALRNGHTHYYEVVVELAEARCVKGECSDQEWQAFFVARDAALEADWPELLDLLLQNWRWRRYYTEYQPWGYMFRDDFFRLIETVGGRDAALDCVPVVTWMLVAGRLNPSFDGLRCNDTLHELPF